MSGSQESRLPADQTHPHPRGREPTKQLYRDAHGTPKGISSLIDSCLPHAAGRVLEPPEVVGGCTTLSKPTMFKGGRTIEGLSWPLGSIPTFKFLFKSILAPRVHPGFQISVQVYPGPSGPSWLLNFCSALSWPLGSIPALNSLFRAGSQRGASCQHPILAHRLPNTRIPNQSPGYYSSLGNRRRTCGHRVMNDRRRAGSIRKAKESSQKNLQAKNPENSGAGTVALFITESLKHRKVPNLGL
ncbi:hypothetical protein CRG98_017616 [Punica granatum]|uniref:Uncharacterized protein n=1 Tax=Punica granatum TaxID=22663 RepID=A0A2I0K090_PUNGR|nr:hypothetical protein CRG98_017616 [Punica granatum]